MMKLCLHGPTIDHERVASGKRNEHPKSTQSHMTAAGSSERERAENLFTGIPSNRRKEREEYNELIVMASLQGSTQGRNTKVPNEWSKLTT